MSDVSQPAWGSTDFRLPGMVAAAPAGAKGFDTDSVLSAEEARRFFDDGFSFAIRYLSLGPRQDDGDLGPREAEMILNSGLALMAVQHVRYTGWNPSQGLGEEDGLNALAHARAAGLPPGINLWLDLEGVASDTPPRDVIEYCNAWFAAVAEGGNAYLPGIYVGAHAMLNGDELYYGLDVEHYWRSGSDVPDVATRGYCMVQTISDRFRLGAAQYDHNFIQPDNAGNTPVWLVASAV